MDVCFVLVLVRGRHDVAASTLLDGVSAYRRLQLCFGVFLVPDARLSMLDGLCLQRHVRD